MGGNTGTILAIVGGAVGSIWGPGGAAIGMSIGSAVGTAIDPPVTPGPKIGDAQAQTSRDGIPIPVVWARCHVVGNIIQMNPINTVTSDIGGKKAKTTETRAYRTFAIGICRSHNGPIAGVLRIWENDKLVYDVRPMPDIPVEDTLAFAEGITIYLGGEDQLPDGDLEAYSGIGFTPAYRGLAYCVFKEKDITDFGQAIPVYRWEVNTEQPLIATSNIYPLDAQDAMEFSIELTSAFMSPIPEDPMDIGVSFIDGSLDVILEQTGPYDDAADIGVSFLNGILRQILIDTGPYDDAADFGVAFLDGTLETKLVTDEAEPEGMEFSIQFTSGSMTPI